MISADSRQVSFTRVALWVAMSASWVGQAFVPPQVSQPGASYRSRRRGFAVVVLSGVSAVVVSLPPPQPAAAQAAVSCADVIVYAVRGSDEPPQPPKYLEATRPFDPKDVASGYADTWDAFDPIDPDTNGSSIAAQKEWSSLQHPEKTPRFIYDIVEKVNERVGPQVRLSWSPIRYPAIPVEPDWWKLLGYAFSYDASLQSGIRELARTLNSQYKRCGTKTRYVLTGYSQGADVVYSLLSGYVAAPPPRRGEPPDYVEYLNLSEGARRQVAAVSLIADPNHDSRDPESYYNIDNKQASTGGLKAFSPALPASTQRITDSFCVTNDAVCSNGITGPNDVSAHRHGHAYADKSGFPFSCRIPLAVPYPASATECAADRIVSRLGLANLRRNPVGESKALPGTTGLDVVFMIDTTGSMQDDIDAAKVFARQAATRIAAVDGRVALVAYKDSEDSVPVQIVTNLTTNQAAFRTDLDGLVADGGGDNPEGLLHALMTAFNTLSWRKGAAKAVVVLTDASFHAPDKTRGETVASVASRSLEIDPVNVFPVTSATGEYAALAEQTSGEVIPNDRSNTVAALTQAFDRIRNRPVALLNRSSYVASPGRPIGFDASGSVAFGSTLKDYSWDWNGDGTYDDVTVEPVTNHRYPDGHSGVMQVRVRDSLGRFANASAEVAVETQPTAAALPPSARTLKAAARLDGRQVIVSYNWTAGGKQPHKWVLTRDGAVVATVPGNRTSAETRGAPLEKPTPIGVYPLESDGNVGVEVAATLPRLVPPPERPAWQRWPLNAALVGILLLAFMAALFVTQRRRKRSAQLAGSADSADPA